MTIQNKNGKILQYKSSSNETIVLQKGEDAVEKEDDENIEPIKPNQSNMLNCNLLFFLFLILLFV